MKELSTEENKDGRIRNAIYDALKYLEREHSLDFLGDVDILDAYAWLEKQGKHADFRNKIQIGDEVTRNEDGVLINLSQLKRVAKKDEKQDEQKSIDKVEPKFNLYDWIVTDKGDTVQIGVVNSGYYTLFNGMDFNISYVDKCWHLWTIQDAKDGDVLAAHECYVIFKEIDGLNIRCHCTYHYMGYNPRFYLDTLQNKTAFHPATKEQRDLLFAKMKEAGYGWDTDKKELIKLYPN